jgi:ribonuclease T2
MRLAPLCAAAMLIGACAPSSGEDDNSVTAAEGTGFDFYVLSLAWSPSYCETEGARANRQQCGPERDFAFIVHGLWPQFEQAYPEFCASDEPQRVPNALVATMRDIMPSAGLVGHQWRKHGTCTGLTQQNYLRATREAFGRIAIPEAFSRAEASQADPNEVESAFIAANPGLSAEGIAVTCAGGRLSEVRICLTKELTFRGCPEIDERACRAERVAIPAAP